MTPESSIGRFIVMATLIELSTPERYAAKGKQFRDWTLDVFSLQDNAKRIADEMNKDGKLYRERSGRQRQIGPNDVLEGSKASVTELGAIVRGHKEFMSGLNGVRP
jgi:hypothetical protein